MTPNPRQSELLEAVRQHGVMSVEALAERFGVTLQTVRRDVKLLAEAGLLSRYHGGVRVPSSTTENIAYRQREMLHADAKQRIARAVAQRVPDGSSLLINLGTTTEAIARELLKHQGLRVITVADDDTVSWYLFGLIHAEVDAAMLLEHVPFFE